MNTSFILVRFFFTLLSVLFFTSIGWNEMNVLSIAMGVGLGATFYLLLQVAESFFKRTNLRALNTTVLGLFFGTLLAQSVLHLSSGAFQLLEVATDAQTTQILTTCVYLFCAYTGVVLTARAADEIHLSIPFVKLQPTTQKKKDILIDSSILLDIRVIDLASSGLVNNLLVVPRFIVKELQQISEGPNETEKTKAKRALDVLKKLEVIPDLNLRYNETDFPEIKETTLKFVRLARVLDASILTADMNRIEQSSIEGITVINIHSLANSLKPITQAGEQITIKVQRYGKEARQGVGYLEDGTMVVINGGAEYIGENIKAQVLSVKHTSSGRMIFCNASEEGHLDEDEESLANIGGSAKNYFAL